jgi:hypothetical protein
VTDVSPLQPLKCLTSQLTQTYNICNPNFRYEVAHNPRRVLTKPSKPCHNGGFDNEDYDYILYVNDMLTADNGTGDKWVLAEKRDFSRTSVQPDDLSPPADTSSSTFSVKVLSVRSSSART